MKPLPSVTCKLALFVGLVVATACVDYDNPGPYQEVDDTVYEVPIDASDPIVFSTGEETALWVEYTGEGLWHVATSCDAYYWQFCDFDMVISIPDDVITGVEAEDLELADDLFQLDEAAVQARFATAADSDGFWFESFASFVRLDVVINGSYDPRPIRWLAGGGLNLGAPSNPVDFRP